MVDGVVGEATERALIDAGASPPPNGALATVPAFTTEVKKGEKIVGRGEKVTREIAAKHAAIARLSAFEWRSALRTWLAGFVVRCSRELRRRPVTALLDDEIVGLRLELRDNIRVPGIADQNPTFSTVRGTHGFPDAHPQVPHPVHRVGST